MTDSCFSYLLAAPADWLEMIGGAIFIIFWIVASLAGSIKGAMEKRKAAAETSRPVAEPVEQGRSMADSTVDLPVDDAETAKPRMPEWMRRALEMVEEATDDSTGEPQVDRPIAAPAVPKVEQAESRRAETKRTVSRVRPAEKLSSLKPQLDMPGHGGSEVHRHVPDAEVLHKPARQGPVVVGKLDAASLRRLVVMREILDPPLALRPPYEG